jgi:hypothetical protein
MFPVCPRQFCNVVTSPSGKGAYPEKSKWCRNIAYRHRLLTKAIIPTLSRYFLKSGSIGRAVFSHTAGAAFSQASGETFSQAGGAIFSQAAGAAFSQAAGAAFSQAAGAAFSQAGGVILSQAAGAAFSQAAGAAFSQAAGAAFSQAFTATHGSIGSQGLQARAALLPKRISNKLAGAAEA